MFYIQGSFWDGPQFKVSLFPIYEEKKPRDKYDYSDMKWNNTHATKGKRRNMHRHCIKVGHFLALFPKVLGAKFLQKSTYLTSKITIDVSIF